MYLMNPNFTTWRIKTYRAKRPVNNRRGNGSHEKIRFWVIRQFSNRPGVCRPNGELRKMEKARLFGCGIVLVSLLIGCGGYQQPPTGQVKVSLAPATTVSNTLVLEIPVKFHEAVKSYADFLVAADTVPPAATPPVDTLAVTPSAGNVPTGDTVYVTPSGAKYHASSCRFAKTGTAISKADAIAKGYTACKACNP